MFTRSRYHTTDMAKQGSLLNELSKLIDSDKLRTTLNETISPINAANLRKAHAKSESGKSIGKIVLAGWK
jgi:NADPH:quinone reductase-like Zn-dependent oxidoreductase